MTHVMLALLAIGALSPLGEPSALVQRARMNKSTIKVIRHAASAPALKAMIEKLGFPVRTQTVKCSGRDFLWITVDEGSGGYVIHGCLYELHADGPRLVLHVPPRSARVALEAKAEQQTIMVLERMAGTPSDTSVVVEYYRGD